MYESILRFVHYLSLTASSFMKRETTLKNAETFRLVVEKDPRMIQGCPPELSIITGRGARALAKETRDGFYPDFTAAGVRKGKQIVYTCGLSGEDIGQAFASAIKCIESMCLPGEQVVFVEDDESRFDLHLTEGPFKYLEQIYFKKLPSYIAKLLRRSPKTRGRTCLGTKYTVPFTMQSGWPDTSVGDTLVNIILKLNAHGPGGKWISIICGDDSVTVTTDRELRKLGGLEQIKSKYTDLGMEVEMMLRTDPLDVEFCSGRFFPSRKGWIMMPKPGKLIGKLGFDMVDRPKKQWVPWLRSISNTCTAFGRYDPSLATLGKSIRREFGEGECLELPKNQFEKYVSGTDNVSWEDTLRYYDHHYGYSERDVLEVQTALTAFHPGITYTHPLLVEMVRCDA
jgi:hypothetical protein